MSTVGAPAPDDIFTNNHRWGDLDEWNRAAVALHERGGIHRVERDGFAPFWAVIDHAAVLEIERKPELFTNGPEPVLQNDHVRANRQVGIKTLIHMDVPDHGKYRRLTNDWFKPASVRRLQDRLDQLSREAVATLEARGGRCDFAVDVALPYPLQVILKILGLPEGDYDRMLVLTQQLFGQEDPDLQREPASPEAAAQVLMDFYQYFTELTAHRRSSPTDDLASLIANGTIDDAPLPDLETMGYYVIVATAGHDTTSSAMSGGMHALIEHPSQREKLAADPSGLMANAVEEMIRWTAPVRHFMRTATADTEVLGQEIKRGEWLYLSYKAANLDPKVFDEPLVFDIERANANRQVAFGYGVHFCLGAQLARNELRSLFTHVLPRLDTVELAGDPTTMKTTFVGGHKTLPIRYTLR
ncbi:MAG: cytochrome P450 [Actinomycetota bacterium]